MATKQYHLPKTDGKNARLKARYGITLETYNDMLFEQDGVCKICKGKNNSKQSLAVDHCHKTGKIRGLLCSPCNIMLGHSKDNKLTLQEAIMYLMDND